MTQLELKSCPFCGGCPQLHTINMGDRWFVACLACVGRGTETYLRDDAIAAWNTRPSPALTPSPQAWVCAKCGAGSVEHGMPNNPSYQCAYEPTLITVPGALTPKQEAADELFDALAKVKREWPHEAPGDCYSTGPLTGDPIADYVVCPGCDVLRAIEAALAKAGRP